MAVSVPCTRPAVSPCWLVAFAHLTAPRRSAAAAAPAAGRPRPETWRAAQQPCAPPSHPALSTSQRHVRTYHDLLGSAVTVAAARAVRTRPIGSLQPWLCRTLHAGSPSGRGSSPTPGALQRRLRRRPQRSAARCRVGRAAAPPPARPGRQLAARTAATHHISGTPCRPLHDPGTGQGDAHP